MFSLETFFKRTIFLLFRVLAKLREVDGQETVGALPWSQQLHKLLEK